MVEVKRAWAQFALPLAPTRWSMLMMEVCRRAEETAAACFTFIYCVTREIGMRLFGAYPFPVREGHPLMHRSILLDESDLLQSIQTAL